MQYQTPYQIWLNLQNYLHISTNSTALQVPQQTAQVYKLFPFSIGIQVCNDVRTAQTKEFLFNFPSLKPILIVTPYLNGGN